MGKATEKRIREVSNPVDDLRAFVELHKGWVENPIILVANEEMAEKVRIIAQENNIPVKVEVVKGKWRKKKP